LGGPERAFYSVRPWRLTGLHCGLYWIEHFASNPGVPLVVTSAMIGLVAVGAALGLPSGWAASFDVSASAVTPVMVFAIQHTQG
jgi:hypothetical protein